MSSKSAQGQGRRTPLTLNPQAKSVPQSQGKQSAVETRGKQPIPAQKPQEQKKDVANKAAAASAAGPGPSPAEKNVSKQQQQQQNVNLKNGFNNGNESKPTSANTNGNKAVAAVAVASVAEPKKENESRAKPAKPAEEQQQQVKNGADAAAKAAFVNNAAGNAAQRKQQQKQTTPQKQPPPPQQQQQQAQPESVKAGEEKALVVEPPKVAVVVPVPENDKTPTPKKMENSNQEQQQKQQTSAGSPTKPSTPKSAGKKRTVTSAIDVDEMNTSPKKAEDTKPTIEHPTATSTPGKPAKIAGGNANPPRTPLDSIARKSIISGRPSIRGANEWTPTKYGSYRAINTDLDVSGANTSLNVTVGSEPGNNTSWFSFSSRKRERTPTSIENVQDDVLSPTKRARFGGIFSMMASPFSALRSRFAKTSIKQECEAEEEEQSHEENNVSMGEEVSMNEIQEEDTPATENLNDSASSVKKEEEKEKEAHIEAKQSEEKKKLTNTETDTDSPMNASAEGATSERCNIM